MTDLGLKRAKLHNSPHTAKTLHLNYSLLREREKAVAKFCNSLIACVLDFLSLCKTCKYTYYL